MIEYTLLIVLAVILFALLVILLKLMAMSRQIGGTKRVGHGFVGEQSRAKQRNLELILGLFGKHETLTNAIIRQELGFDDRVIVNYMDELERLGKVRQVGKTGLHAHYELVR